MGGAHFRLSCVFHAQCDGVFVAGKAIEDARNLRRQVEQQKVELEKAKVDASKAHEAEHESKTTKTSANSTQSSVSGKPATGGGAATPSPSAPRAPSFSCDSHMAYNSYFAIPNYRVLCSTSARHKHTNCSSFALYRIPCIQSNVSHIPACKC